MALPGQKGQILPSRKTRRVEMKDQDTVGLMFKLSNLNWGTKRIARELGCSRNTVRHYLRQGGWRPAKAPERVSALCDLGDWLRETFLQHAGNAEVVRQELISQKKIEVSLRTVERAVKPFRMELEAQARATLRFETVPGEQIQIDFGSKKVKIDGIFIKVHIFVATLGYSRRCFVRLTRHERQHAWFCGLEGAFNHFQGVTEKVLLDNARALVSKHNVQQDELIFNSRFLAFCKHWDISPRACKPRRARTKGKVESGVKYVKNNALAGHEFDSWEAMESRLVWWLAEIADKREHGTTAEQPIVRFNKEERKALKPLDGRVPFIQIRELERRVHNDSCVLIDTNAYSVPWKYIRSVVTVIIGGGQVEVIYAGESIAVHAELPGKNRRSIERTHLNGIVVEPCLTTINDDLHDVEEASELSRSLKKYEDAAGGAW